MLNAGLTGVVVPLHTVVGEALVGSSLFVNSPFVCLDIRTLSLTNIEAALQTSVSEPRIPGSGYCYSGQSEPHGETLS